jgi:hypothetical protein
MRAVGPLEVSCLWRTLGVEQSPGYGALVVLGVFGVGSGGWSFFVLLFDVVQV